MGSEADTFELRAGLVTASFDTTCTADAALAALGDSVPDASVLRWSRSNWFDLRVPSDHDPGNYVARLLRIPGVTAAVPAFLVHFHATPNDTYFSNQWALQNTGQSGGTTDADVDAPAAWDSVTGDTTAVIAIIDSGADLDHSDLATNIWCNWTEAGGTPDVDDDSNGYVDDVYGWDFWDNDGDPNHGGTESLYHGSHVAGIASAKTNNATGVAGVAGGWGSTRGTGARLMTIRIGLNDDLDADVVADAIYYAVDNGADVVNMSFGGGDAGFPDIRAAVNYAWSDGVLLVASSGNEECVGTGCLEQPANMAKVMAVGATTHTDAVSDYSNGGPELNLVAPGGHTSQSSATKVYGTLGGSSYGYMSGTSMAAPHVCGAAALALSADPTLTLTELWKLLEFSADDEAGTAAKGWEDDYGWGRLNVGTMLKAIEYAAHSGYTYPDADCKVFCPAADADSFAITVTIEDANEDPVQGIPATAIWAEPKVSTFDLCCVAEDAPDCIIEYPNRVFARSATGAQGQTTIVLKAAGGSGKFTPVRVMLYGLELSGTGVLELIPFRSYDIDKDCAVDGADFSIFNGIMGTLDARGDFDCDGDVDSADSLLLAAHSAHQCPGRGGPAHPRAAGGEVSIEVRSWPNPFSPSTEIACSILAGPVQVDLAVYDVAGRRVRTLFSGERDAGVLTAAWDGTDDAGRRLASGVYFCRAATGDAAEVRKLLLLR